MVNDQGKCNGTRVSNSLFELAEAHRPTPSHDDRVNKNIVEPVNATTVGPQDPGRNNEVVALTITNNNKFIYCTQSRIL